MRSPVRVRNVVGLLATVVLVAAAAPPGVPGPAREFKIGLLLPYSGVFARLGESMTQATEMYFESIGWTVAGRRLVLIKEDEGVPNTEVAVRKFRKFVDQDRVDLVTGVVSSGSLAALVDPIREARVITIISNAGFDGATREKRSPWLFRTSFTNWQIAAAQGEWAARNIGKRAVTLQADYQVGRDNVRAFKDTFEPAGGRVVGGDLVSAGDARLRPLPGPRAPGHAERRPGLLLRRRRRRHSG